MRNIVTTFFLSGLLLLNVVPVAHAQNLDCNKLLGSNYTSVNGLCFPKDLVGSKLDEQSPGQIISTVIQVLLQFAGIVAVIFIIYGGYLLMTSAGNEEGAAKGKKALTYSLLGLVVIMLAYAIVLFVSRVVISGRIGT